MAHNSDAGIAAVSRLLRNGAPVAGDAGGGIALLAEIRLTRPLATVLRALRLAAFVDALDKLVARHRARLGSAHPSAQGEELLAQQLGRYFPMLGDHGSVGLLNPVAEDGVLPPDQAHSVRFHPSLDPRSALLGGDTPVVGAPTNGALGIDAVVAVARAAQTRRGIGLDKVRERLGHRAVDFP